MNILCIMNYPPAGLLEEFIDLGLVDDAGPVDQTDVTSAEASATWPG